MEKQIVRHANRHTSSSDESQGLSDSADTCRDAAHPRLVHLTTCAVLAALPEARLEPLQRVQNSAARLIMGSRKTDHISPGTALAADYKIAVLIFRCLSFRTGASLLSFPILKI